MTLRSSRLRDLEKPSRSVNDRAELCCEVAREFENKGDYENARKALSSFWRRIGERPKLEGLEASTAGEVLLRVGVLHRKKRRTLSVKASRSFSQLTIERK
jgi:hypothetical protein